MTNGTAPCANESTQNDARELRDYVATTTDGSRLCFSARELSSPLAQLLDSAPAYESPTTTACGDSLDETVRALVCSSDLSDVLSDGWSERTIHAVLQARSCIAEGKDGSMLMALRLLDPVLSEAVDEMFARARAPARVTVLQ